HLLGLVHGEQRGVDQHDCHDERGEAGNQGPAHCPLPVGWVCDDACGEVPDEGAAGAAFGACAGTGGGTFSGRNGTRPFSLSSTTKVCAWLMMSRIVSIY